MATLSAHLVTNPAAITKAHRVNAPVHDSLRAQARVGPVSSGAWAILDAHTSTLAAAVWKVASMLAQHRLGIRPTGDTRAWTVDASDMQLAFESLGLPTECDTRGGMSSTRLVAGDEDEDHKTKKAKKKAQKQAAAAAAAAAANDEDEDEA